MLESLNNPSLLIILAIINTPLYYYIGTIFYNTVDEFTDGIRYVFQPDWLSASRGEHADDIWESVKVYIYVLTCASVVTMQYKLFS